MNDSIYEEYMRNVLGYQPANYYDTYDMDYESFGIPIMPTMNVAQIQDLENCYPDIYRIIYPMVQRACSRNTMPVTRELVDSMTEEIYLAVEDKDIVENRNKEDKIVKTTEIKQENRQIVRNTGLNDLIRILLLRELLGKPGFPGGRPPRLPIRPPMRPPIGPGGRPPMRPRSEYF